MPYRLDSTMCTQAQLASMSFQRWLPPLKEVPTLIHRKLWEWCYISQALDERGMLQPGRRGLGFAVGREPLSALFASRGCSIIATDLDAESEAAVAWQGSWQHAANLHALNDRGICPADVFEHNVTFRPVDMNAVPDDLHGFDFLWSSCSLEHLGTLERGMEFVHRAMDCLKPGGVAVHTTEYNCDSNDATLTEGLVSIYRRRDIERLARELRMQGYTLTLRFPQATESFDTFVDIPPYAHNPHLRLWMAGFIVTSYGLIIHKPINHLKRRVFGIGNKIMYKAAHLAGQF